MDCPRCHREVSKHTSRCRWCGAEIPRAQHLLEDSGIIPARSKPAAAAVCDESPRVASLGDRSIAHVLDATMLLSLLGLADAWMFVRWGAVGGSELALTGTAVALAGILNATLFLAYFVLLEAAFGATMGKALLDIGVVQIARRDALTGALIRNLLRVVDGLGFYLLGILVASCSRLRRRIGDMCAGTVVLEREFPVGIRALAVLLWCAALTSAILTLPRILSARNAASPGNSNHAVVQLGHSDHSLYLRIARLRIDVGLAAAPSGVTAERAE